MTAHPGKPEPDPAIQARQWGKGAIQAFRSANLQPAFYLISAAIKQGLTVWEEWEIAYATAVLDDMIDFEQLELMSLEVELRLKARAERRPLVSGVVNRSRRMLALLGTWELGGGSDPWADVELPTPPPGNTQ